MFCKNTKKDEWQRTVKESENGVYLECSGCGKVRGYEIGFFADVFQGSKQKGEASG